MAAPKPTHEDSQAHHLVLELNGVSVSYAVGRQSSVEAVRDFSLQIRHGDVVSLVGPSGCGKTSLLRVIAGLRPLSRGDVRFETARGQAPFAVIFQSPSLFPWRTAADNAAYGVECITKDRKLAREKALEALALVGMADYRDYYPAQLSGGMQQRVNVARAIAVEPAVLLLDEPFASLDAQLRERMQVELLRVLSATDATALLVTHQVDEAVYLSNQVAVMLARPGRLRTVIDVGLDKQGGVGVKRGPEFAALCDVVWEHLEDPAQLEGAKTPAGAVSLNGGQASA